VAAAVLAILPLVGCGAGGDGSQPQVAPLAATSTPAAPTTVAVITTTTTIPPTTPAPTTAAPTTAAPTTPAPTTTQPLPVPAPVPGPDTVEPVIEVGVIEIPRIGVNMTMFSGITDATLDLGPGHWPGTALPGQVGNVVVAGHRVSHHRVFRNIDQLQPGDQIVFTVQGVRSVYEVVASEVVTPDALRIVDQTREHTATLFACHPPGSTRERFVVHARQRFDP
jgi:sortase A